MGNTLRYEGFRNVLLSQLRRRLTGSCGIRRVSKSEAVKNNDTVMEMILVEMEDGRAAPILYLQDLYRTYQEGADLGDILQGLCELYTTYASMGHPVEEELSELLDDWEKTKQLITFRMINGAKNTRRMKNKPFSRLGEFLLAYQIQIGDGHGGFYATQVTDDMLKEWGIDEAELHEIAVANMNLPGNYQLLPMEEATGIRIDSSVKPEDRPEIYVLTSRAKVNGATVIYSDEVKQKVASTVGGDYYLLPSSIHEWVVISKRWAQRTEKMEHMVQDINDTSVEDEDFLSNHVYEYDAEKEQMRQALSQAVLM